MQHTTIREAGDSVSWGPIEGLLKPLKHQGGPQLGPADYAKSCKPLGRLMIIPVWNQSWWLGLMVCWCFNASNLIVESESSVRMQCNIYVMWYLVLVFMSWLQDISVPDSPENWRSLHNWRQSIQSTDCVCRWRKGFLNLHYFTQTSNPRLVGCNRLTIIFITTCYANNCNQLT